MKSKLANEKVVATDLMMQLVTFTKSTRKVLKLAVVLTHNTNIDKEVEMNN